MQSGTHQGESSSGTKSSKSTSVDLILALIEEYREKKKGDKNSKLTRFLPMLDERQRRMLVSMGLKYVKSEDVKTAYDVVHAKRVANFGPGVDEPFGRNEVPTLSYDAVAFLQAKLQADADEKALEAAVASLLGTKTGRIEFSKWDERVIKEIKQLFLVVDPSQIHAMFKVIKLPPVNKSNLLDVMIEFTGDVLATLEKINLSGMSTEGRERILKNLNQTIDAQAHNIAELIMEATEEKTPSLPLDEWAEHVMSVTRKALENGSLDDLANDGSQQRIEALENENEFLKNELLKAQVARGVPANPAQPGRTWCSKCDRMTFHTALTCDPSKARPQAAPTGKGDGKGDGKGKGSGKSDGKGKGNDQLSYAEWLREKQQRRN